MTPPNVIFIPAFGGSFVPTDVAGCVSWFDADDSSTITISTGVSNWADKSGNTASSPYDTADFSQVTAAYQPTVSAAHLNGRDVITFDGSDDVLVGRMPYFMTSASVFIVASTSDTQYIHMNRGSTTYSVVAHSGSTSQTLSSAFGTPTHYVTGNPTSWITRNDVYIGLNGTHVYEAIGCDLSGFANSGGTMFYDLCGYGSGFSMAGDVAELLIYDSSLAQSDREKVEGYLAHKWGLAADLPSGHPYKSSAP